jgi:hypothetical protein
MTARTAFGIAALLGALLNHEPAVAQFASSRAIDQAVNLNVGQALQRIQVQLQAKQPPSPTILSAIDTSGSRLFVAHRAGEFEVWNLDEGRVEMRTGLNDSPVRAAEFGADGAVVVLRENGRLSVVRKGTERESSVGGTAGTPVAGVSMHPTQPRAFLLRADGTIDILDYQADRAVATVRTGIATAQALAVDRSGSYAAVAEQRQVTIWDISTGLRVNTIDLSRTDDVSRFVAAAFGVSADRLTLLTARGDVVLLKGAQVTPRSACKDACELAAVRLEPTGEAFTAITATGEQLEWKRSQREGSVARSVGLTAPINGRVSLTATMAAFPLADGTIHLRKLAAKGAAEPIMLTTTPNGWIAIDSTGRFDGPSAAHDDLTWVGTNLAANLTNFAAQYYEPGLLRKWAAGASPRAYLTSPPPIDTGVAVPPLAAVNATITAGKTARKNVRIAIQAEDRGGGLGQIYLYHQGLLVSERRLINDKKETGAGNRVRRVMEYDVQATSGLNNFGVTAENAEGVLSPLLEQSITVDQRAVRPRLHVLVIGLNKYKTPRLNLDYARRDAEQLAQTLRSQGARIYESVNVTSLYDEEIERDTLLQSLAELKAANPEDTVVVYFAGHGEVLENEFYFLTHSVKYPFKAADAKKNGLGFTELADMAADLEARRVILLLDTCKSGDALGNIDQLDRDRRVLGIFGGRLGVHFLAGTDKGQLAAELSSLGHGLFTYSLLQALDGKADLKPADGLISVKEMIDYAEQVVTDLSREQTQTAQRPTAVSRGYDFAVARK